MTANAATVIVLPIVWHVRAMIKVYSTPQYTVAYSSTDT